MRVSQSRRTLVVLGLAALFVPFAIHAQVREVVSKEVSVGRAEATLRLELADENSLEISFRDGSVLVDGDVVGSFEPGGDLDAAWRELLSQAVTLEDGPLARALMDWTAPARLAGRLADVAQSVDRALEEALTDVDVRVDAAEPSVSVSVGDAGALARVLVGSVGRLALLEEALAGLEANFRVHVAEDVVVPADEVIQGNLVVIDGDVSIEGEVDGDVVVIGGTLELLEGSSVTGAVRLAEARLLRNQGTVGDGVVDVQDEERDLEAELRVQLRDEIREEVRRDLRNELRSVARNEMDDDGFSLMAPFRPIIHGVGGVLGNLVGVLVLGLIGAAVMAFGGEKVDVIAETARGAPARSAMVGLAGTFLLFPIWILGFVALVVTIIGIPVAIAWLPLFPLAACLAGGVGYLVVARSAGEWLADSDYPWTHWIRKSNPLITMFGGLLGLMLLFIAANVVSILPFLGFLTGLLFAAGCVVTFLAVQIGFGAVVLTRAGRRREHWSRYDPEEVWQATVDADVGETAAAEAETADVPPGDQNDA